MSGYAGSAVLHTPAGACPVEVVLTGRFEPADGRYHWGGRIAAHDYAAGLVRGGTRTITISVADAVPVPARLAEVDPWGGIRVTGTGRPPWPPEYEEDPA